MVTTEVSVTMKFSASSAMKTFVSSNVTIVRLYCGGGISASANALALASVGVRDVRVYDGSLEEWSADPGLPLVAAGAPAELAEGRG